MPSPFPGMDPYLEHPAIFAGIHDSFVTYLREALQLRLPDPYYAEIGDRVWVEVSDRMIGPDVNVLRGDNRSRARHTIIPACDFNGPSQLPSSVHPKRLLGDAAALRHLR